MDIPVSKFYSITKANGVDVVHFSDNSFRYFLKNSFHAFRYSNVGNHVYSIIESTVVSEETYVAYNSCKENLIALAILIVQTVRNNFLGDDDVSIADIVSYDYNVDYKDYSYASHIVYERFDKIIQDVNRSEEDKANAQKNIDLINAIDEQMFNDFIALCKYIVDFYVQSINLVTDAFDKDVPMSFSDIYLLLKECNEKTYLIDLGDSDLISPIDNVELRESMTGNFIVYTYSVFAYNGKTYFSSTDQKVIRSYNGKIAPSKLGLKNPVDSDIERIKARAKKVFDINIKPSYSYYTGTMMESTGWFGREVQATGRCMVDINTLMQINPGFNNYFPYGIRDSVRNSTSVDKILFDDISDDFLLCMTPYVYMFSFVVKKWARVLIDNVSDIVFRADAFDKLIIDPEIKDLMFSLVDCTKMGDAIVGQDIIDNKGGGSIFLLAGKPGLGKTLSAETVAETLKRPLYMVGVGELGTDPQSLEKNLARVLDTASAWNAILLLDECDIFMEARQNMDVHRNAMVGVFLRLLEYYPGIMFLTTNRSSNIDEAFFSRISLAIQFPDLDVQSRYSIWKNIIALYGNKINQEDIDIDLLSHVEINGRQIKNAAKLAVAYSSYKNKIPTTRDFIAIIENAKKFSEKK